jgi:hypothetical protein
MMEAILKSLHPNHGCNQNWSQMSSRVFWVESTHSNYVKLMLLQVIFALAHTTIYSTNLKALNKYNYVKKFYKLLFQIWKNKFNFSCYNSIHSN